MKIELSKIKGGERVQQLGILSGISDSEKYNNNICMSCYAC